MKAKYVWMAGLLALSSLGMQAKNMDEFLGDLQSEKNLTRITMGPVIMKISSLFTETMGANSIRVFVWRIVLRRHWTNIARISAS